MRCCFLLFLLSLGIYPLPAQLALAPSHTLELRFPGKPLDDDLRGLNVVMLDEYLLFFPGDYSFHLFYLTDTGYAYRSTVKMWQEGKRNFGIYHHNYFQVIDSHLVGIDGDALFVYDLRHPEQCAFRKSVSHRSKEYISSGLGRLHVVARGEDQYALFVPVWGKIYPSKPKDFGKYPPSLSSENTAHELLLTRKGRRWKLKLVRQFGHHRHDQAKGNAAFAFYWSQLAGADSLLYLSSMSSNWIWKYTCQGELRDSIQAPGAAMPPAFIAPLDPISIQGVTTCVRHSSFFGTPQALHGGDMLVREYFTPESEGGVRNVYLQAIDTRTKAVREMPMAAGRRLGGVWNDLLVIADSVDHARGYLRLQYYRLALPD